MQHYRVVSLFSMKIEIHSLSEVRKRGHVRHIENGNRWLLQTHSLPSSGLYVVAHLRPQPRWRSLLSAVLEQVR